MADLTLLSALTGDNPVVTVTVKELPCDVGVDSYNKMIDRVSRDNRKESVSSERWAPDHRHSCRCNALRCSGMRDGTKRKCHE